MSIITLPRSAIKELSDKYVIIEIPKSDLETSFADLINIKNAKGILKEKKINDLLKYVKKSRDEWDRL